MKTIRFYRALAGDERGPYLGAAVLKPRGWRFIPGVSGRKTSRRVWPTWEACVPRWVGYPDKCMSDRAVDA